MANMIIFSVLVENSRYLEYEGLIIDDLKLNNLTTRIFPLSGISSASPTNSLEQRPENRSEERNMLVKFYWIIVMTTSLARRTPYQRVGKQLSGIWNPIIELEICTTLSSVETPK
ncbi:hypothetical protein HZH68_016142 [Vespula germanica]|uniref:Uncharacterized protein n=1 Tax=Vespula germanica TaxID=30212 RepID=A0A834J623_VESGE|nr:hypothetical protein HZH68_016142 [Vespula germanica]